MTSASKPRAAAAKPRGKGLQFDPKDPTDRKIMARQQRVAVQAGREGRDRAAVTRGRPDLEAAYDSGAQQGTVPAEEPQQGKRGKRGSGGPPADESAGPSRFSRFRQMGPGWGSLKPTSPTRLPSRWSDAGGFGAGIALYMVAVIYIRYGPAGWSGWLSAKFLNKPINTGNTSGASSDGKPTSSSGGSRFV